MYAYLQMGKESDAKRFSMDYRRSRHDSIPTRLLAPLPALGACSRSQRIRGARDAVSGVRGQKAAALEPKASAYPYTEAMTYFAVLTGASHTGDFASKFGHRFLAVDSSSWAEREG